ncbi:hypothetical protein KJ810_00140 [Patescibacteria group bacterium]|nr:hypothetical protein [Patescibacteria group bacterium]
MFILAALTFAGAFGVMLGVWLHWIPGAILGVAIFTLFARLGENRKGIFWRWLLSLVVGGLLFQVDYRLGIFTSTALYGILVSNSKLAPVSHRGSYGLATEPDPHVDKETPDQEVSS